jgi:hypothetical protein
VASFFTDGRTVTASPGTGTYKDWIALLVVQLTAEDDGAPVLLEANIGGLLSVEATARWGRAAAVVATCLLDSREKETLARR